MTKADVALSGFAFLVAVAAAPAAGWAASAEDNYRLYCVQCHGTLGNGQGINQTSGGLAVSPRDHTDAQDMGKLTDEELRLAIGEGGDAVQKSELMPAWGKTLSAEEIDDLAVFLRKLCKCAGGK